MSFGNRIIGDILLLLAMLLTADVLFIMPARMKAVVLKTVYRKVFLYQLFLCAVLLVFALDIRFNLFTRWQSGTLNVIGWILRAAVILAAAGILFFCGKIIAGGLVNTAGRAGYALVLGLALENGKPVPALLARLDATQAYLEKYPEARLILTGGNADESGRTEAAVMRDILLEKGVPESRMILEDRSETTVENFRNTAAIISKDEPVVIITSDYHMDRAVRNAREEGFTHLMRLPVSSGILAFGANMLTEIIANVHDLTVK